LLCVKEVSVAFFAGKFGRELGKEMVFSTINEVVFDGRAKGPPSIAGVFTDVTAKLIHDQFKAEMKARARAQRLETTPMKPLSVSVKAPKPERLPVHNFTRQEIEEIRRPFPMLESQAIQKLMGHQVIDTFDAGDLQRSKIQAAVLGKRNTE
jgi:hypothetical protein